mgnify:FL=1
MKKLLLLLFLIPNLVMGEESKLKFIGYWGQVPNGTCWVDGYHEYQSLSCMKSLEKPKLDSYDSKGCLVATQQEQLIPLPKKILNNFNLEKCTLAGYKLKPAISKDFPASLKANISCKMKNGKYIQANASSGKNGWVGRIFLSPRPYDFNKTTNGSLELVVNCKMK